MLIHPHPHHFTCTAFIKICHMMRNDQPAPEKCGICPPAGGFSAADTFPVGVRKRVGSEGDNRLLSGAAQKTSDIPFPPSRTLHPLLLGLIVPYLISSCFALNRINKPFKPFSLAHLRWDFSRWVVNTGCKCWNI